MSSSNTKSKIKSKTKKNEKSIEDIYKKMDPHTHILTESDMYIGGRQEDDQAMWILDNKDPEDQKIVLKTIKYVPGLYKIFDEIIVNARDQSIKDKTCKTIKVDINQETGEITCMNDGNKGIPVEIHKEHKMYVPEMIFGHLLTSGNYGQKGKTWGGKNGYGAKLANIFSTDFYVEVVDSQRKKKFIQQYTNNMWDKEEATVIDCDNSKSYCLIKFKPDFKKFGITALTDNIVSLFEKRVYDMAALTRDNVKVYLNNKKININNFQEYVNMFYDEDTIKNKMVYSRINDRWKVGVVFDPDSGFRHVSYVNGICTFKGGSHVNHVLDQIVGGLADHINSQAKYKKLNIKNAIIKDNLTFFIDSVIEDPSFNSQTKEDLSSKLSSFGSRCEVDPKFIKDLAKTGVVSEVVDFANLKAMQGLKKTDGKKKQTLRGMDKLDDAKLAGSRRSTQCRLILTEGDSAKTFAVSGTDIIGRDRYGVFPLKGKLLNVRDANPKQLLNNEELKNIKQIMGLKHGQKYDDISKLRYGGIIILTDEDYDGYHIKGLLMNFIHYFWPSLLKRKGFVQSLATPIVKVWKATDTKKKKPKIFYTMTEYKAWLDKLGGSLRSKGWRNKYYKGLGSSTDTEAKEAFLDFDKKLISYIWSDNQELCKDNEIVKKYVEDVNDASDSNTETEEDNKSEKSDYDIETDKTNESYQSLILAFSKSKANDRKKWLKNYDKDNIIENSETNVSYSDFVNRGLIHFSNYDCERSLPNLCDGLKTSQRKIMYVTMKRNYLKNEIKVAQLSGYISAEAAYHHGEASLQGAIIGMAQNYVGSNNINLLTPNGNFGTRRLGGKDASSPRYIFTQLNELSPLLFRKEDNPVYKYLEDDGENVEPVYYTPIIPTVLVNGADGIGTGFSTNIPCFNPLEIINNVKKMIKNQEPTHMIPWYKGFTGAIEKVDDNTYKTKGTYEIINERTIIITELPIGTWTDNYKNFLDTLVCDDKKSSPGQILERADADCGNNSIKFTLRFARGELQKLLKNGTIEKVLKLTKSVKTSNMHLYNSKGTIKKYNTVVDIMKEYYNDRILMYKQRKAYYLKFLVNQLNLLKYKIMFLKYVISGKIVVIINKKAKKKSEVIDRLEELEFPKLHTNPNADVDDKSYGYITNIPLFALTSEEMEKLQDEFAKKDNETNVYKNTSIESIWKNELDELAKAYNKWLLSEEEDMKANDKICSKDKLKKKKNKK